MARGVAIELRPLGANDPVVRDILREQARMVAGAARKRAPRRTGRLAGSISSRVATAGGKAAGIVTATAPYARFVHDGTGIYGPRGQMIRPRRARMLSWRDRDTGEQIFAKAVRGVPPRPFLIQALADCGLKGVRRS